MQWRGKNVENSWFQTTNKYSFQASESFINHPHTHSLWNGFVFFSSFRRSCFSQCMCVYLDLKQRFDTFRCCFIQEKMEQKLKIILINLLIEILKSSFLNDASFSVRKSQMVCIGHIYEINSFIKTKTKF